MFGKLFEPKSKRRRKVRRMGNFSTHVEFMIYVVMAIVILVAVAISLYTR